MAFVPPECPVCKDQGVVVKLWLFQINLEEALWMCPVAKCSFPFNHPHKESLLVRRDYMDMVRFPGSAEKCDEFYAQGGNPLLRRHASDIPLSSANLSDAVIAAVASVKPIAPSCSEAVSFDAVDGAVDNSESLVGNNTIPAAATVEENTCLLTGLPIVSDKNRKTLLPPYSSNGSTSPLSNQRTRGDIASAKSRSAPDYSENAAGTSSKVESSAEAGEKQELLKTAASTSKNADSMPESELDKWAQSSKPIQSVLRDIIAKQKQEIRKHGLDREQEQLASVQDVDWRKIKKPRLHRRGGGFCSSSGGDISHGGTSCSAADDLQMRPPKFPANVGPKLDKVFSRKPIAQLFHQVALQKMKEGPPALSPAALFSGYVSSSRTPLNGEEAKVDSPSTSGSASPATATAKSSCIKQASNRKVFSKLKAIPGAKERMLSSLRTPQASHHVGSNNSSTDYSNASSPVANDAGTSTATAVDFTSSFVLTSNGHVDDYPGAAFGSFPCASSNDLGFLQSAAGSTFLHEFDDGHFATELDFFASVATSSQHASQNGSLGVLRQQEQTPQLPPATGVLESDDDDANFSFF